MRIKSKDDLLMRVSNAIAALSKDGRYPESLASLKDAEYEMDINDFEEAKRLLSDTLHNDDKTLPMHPEVSGLLMDIYLDGVEERDPDYMCKLGSLFYTGRAGERDYVRAAKYYHLAEKGGNEQAAENLGYIYYYGRTGEKDYMKAFNYFVKGAATGNVRSLYKIGDFYRNGFYVEKDPKEAFNIYERCTEMISDELVPEVGADVYMRMGDCYLEGLGVEKDLFLALSFMTSAEGLIYKRLSLGDFYQRNNLKHVLEAESRIREEITNELLPDLSWAHFGDNDVDTTVKKETENADDKENSDAKSQETEKKAKNESDSNVFDMIRKDWDKILEVIRKDYDVLNVSFDMWLKPLRLFDLINKHLLLIVPEEGYIHILEKKYSQIMEEVIEKTYNIPIKIHFVTEKEAYKLTKKNNNVEDQGKGIKKGKVKLSLNDFDWIRRDWNKLLDGIKNDYDILQVQFDTWLKPLRLYDLIDNELLITVPEEGYVKILEKKYSVLIKAAIELKYDIPLKIRFITESKAKELSVKKKTPLICERKKDVPPLGYNNAAIYFTNA